MLYNVNIDITMNHHCVLLTLKVHKKIKYNTFLIELYLLFYE